MTAPADRQPILDGWRGIAIALVLVGHFLPKTPGFMSGLLGVNVFFVLSGLLMSNLLFVRRTPLGTFYKRRASRILPVFLLFVAVVFSVASWRGIEWQAAELWATLLFLRTYYPLTPGLWDTPLPIGHFWSLSVEEHSYLLLGLLSAMAWLRGREAWALIGLGLLSILVYVAFAKVPGLAPPWGDLGTEALAGHLMLSAGYFLLRDRLRPFVRPWMPLAAIAIAIACHMPVLLPKWSSVLVSPFALAFAVNHLEQLPRTLVRLLAWAPLRQLGIWSYSIYIWQQPVFLANLPYGPGLLLALGIGIASFHLFEDPTRRWLNRKFAA